MALEDDRCEIIFPIDWWKVMWWKNPTELQSKSVIQAFIQFCQPSKQISDKIDFRVKRFRFSNFI
jgi:hypothetical protein